MSFSIEYKELFSVAVVDKDDAAVNLPGFSFAPGSECQRILDDYQLVFRQRPGGFQVFYSLHPEAADPLVASIEAYTRFPFKLALHDRGFLEDYEPDLTGATGSQLYLDNLTSDGEFSANPPLSRFAFVKENDAAQIVPRIFTVESDQSVTTPPTEWRVKDLFDDTLVSKTAIESTGGSSATTQIDLSGEPAGPYTLQADGTGSPKRTIYVDNDFAAARAFGAVEIIWAAPQTTAPAGGQAYLIPFKKR